MGAFYQKILTPQGERDVYDGVSACSRCGYCEQACPTYVATGKEGYGPRGRNQLFRLMLEGRLKDFEKASEALSSCLLCGACSSVCYAGVQTSEYVLEGRRYIRRGKAPAAARLLAWSLRRPSSFAWALRAVNAVRRTGAPRLAARLGLPSLFGLEALQNAELEVRRAPLRFASDRLASEPGLNGGNWLYFQPCGTNYLFPDVAVATVRAARALHGEGRLFGEACCGLLAYNYGDVDDARELARRVIARYETALSAPLVVDCSSCASHLKNYEQLFAEDPVWRPRARAFAAKVRDVLELLAPAAARAKPKASPLRATYHDSCRARNGQGLAEPPRQLLRALLGASYVELPEPDACCGGAGAFSLLHPELSDAISRRKISAIASTQADLVLTSGTSCLLQLEGGLRKYYPEARVQHLSEFVAERLLS